MGRRILVFQHIEIEHPGIFRSFFDEDRVDWVAIELDRGEPIPSLDGYDALWVMGGPMDVWQEREHPWLVAEKAAIKEAVEERAMPFLGLCLGHQLLAESLGGRVGPSDQAEIGVLDVQLTEAGKASPFLRNVAETVRCLQWHSAEVKLPPPGAVVLASSPSCPVQAISLGGKAFSAQFHVEISPDTVAEWGQVPAYQQALERNLGEDGLVQLDAAATVAMADFNRCARVLYDNWTSQAFG